jgi:hypothetical protein
MKDELQSIRNNDVWEVVPRPTNWKIVDAKWVHKIKSDTKGELKRYKPRLVAKEFCQKHGLEYDEICAPVVHYDSLRLILTISACKYWKPHQFNVKTAFLYSILEKEI